MDVRLPESPGSSGDNSSEQATVLEDSTFAFPEDIFGCTALLIQQGLRPTTRGGHLVVDEAMRAQFGDTFRPFRALRIRRNELEYPAMPDDAATYDEVREALSDAGQIISAVEKLLPHLGLF
ncbi:hypothetical protein [Actinoallomurus sp. NPDC050550]|uniref:hypothetical protein n=1 Tax=Actinoallomurus sp. NPDC050550 TaxID=3154937 RepID=UPI0033C10975